MSQLRKWLVGLALSLCCFTAHAQAAYVQSNSVINASTIAFSSNVTAGDVLIAACYITNGTRCPNTATDSQGNAYEQLTSQNNNTLGTAGRPAVFATVAGTTGADTVTMTNGNSDSVLAVFEYSAGTTPVVSILEFAYSCPGGLVSYGLVSPSTTGNGAFDIWNTFRTGSLSSARVLSLMFTNNPISAPANSGATIRQNQVGVSAGSFFAGDQSISAAITPSAPFSTTYTWTNAVTCMSGISVLVGIPSSGGGSTVLVSGYAY